MLFWLSFCDPDRPKGEQFLGAAIIEAVTLKGALTASWMYGCNPGGEVASLEIPQETQAMARPHLHRLMQREEIELLFGETRTGEELDRDQLSQIRDRHGKPV